MDIFSFLDAADSHPLLEPRSPAYTHATVRRAFIVWLRCGQVNEFRDVCNYYHRLEALEEQLSTGTRETSRNHEYSLYTNLPPTSPYQQYIFPHLYSYPYPQQNCHIVTQPYIPNYLPFQSMIIERVKDTSCSTETEELKESFVSPQEIFDASQVFKAPVGEVNEKIAANFDIPLHKKTASDILKEVLKIADNITTELSKTEDKAKGTSKQDIIETSQIIKNYCRKQKVPMKNFLENFKEYASRCELKNTVTNVGFYVKRKMVHSELDLAVTVNKIKTCNGTKVEPKLTSKIELNGDVSSKVATELKEMISVLNVRRKNNITNEITNQEPENKNKMTNCVDDLVTSDENSDELKNCDSDSIIMLLRREDELKSSTGFSNSHNIVKFESVKCRKI